MHIFCLGTSVEEAAEEENWYKRNKGQPNPGAARPACPALVLALGLPPSTAPLPHHIHSGGVTPFSDLFRVLGDSQERRYGAISLCHGHECELMDALVSPSLFPFPSVSICPSPLFCRVNWEKWVWMALMEKRSVILITFLFITRCFSEASKKHLESSKYSKVFFFFRETKVCLAPLERRDTLAGG